MEKKYYIISINCDCSSYRMARNRHPDITYGFIRCQLCGKKLGPMDHNVLEMVYAKGDIEALAKYRDIEKKFNL